MLIKVNHSHNHQENKVTYNQMKNKFHNILIQILVRSIQKQILMGSIYVK